MRLPEARDDSTGQLTLCATSAQVVADGDAPHASGRVLAPGRGAGRSGSGRLRAHAQRLPVPRTAAMRLRAMAQLRRNAAAPAAAQRAGGEAPVAARSGGQGGGMVEASMRQSLVAVPVIAPPPPPTHLDSSAVEIADIYSRGPAWSAVSDSTDRASA